MFCKKCGYKNADDAKFCVSCGEKIEQIETNNDKVRSFFETNSPSNNEMNNFNSTYQEPVREKKLCSPAVAGFVVSIVGLFFAGMICGILGIIFSATALNQMKKNENLKGNGFAIAGLIISIVDIVLMLIMYITISQVSMMTGF